jgi:hypothetical protein
MFTGSEYLWRAFCGKNAEKILGWHRAGRVVGESALKLVKQPWRSFFHLPLSILPAGLHRLITDWQYAKDRVVYLTVRPVRLYFDAELRKKWLEEMLIEGKKKRLLNDEDADTISSQINDPFIQKYLKSLAVHVCTLPVTQVVSVIVVLIFWIMNPEMSSKARGLAAAGILVAFQVTPVSPGSLVRGFYVLYLVIRERNFKDYNIAVFLGFFKYIGYLAFPIQMTQRYPALARFMAGHWATEAVHAVPVFGERGALLEHGVFCLFYNRPLTIRRRMRARSQMRAAIAPRYWHIVFCAILGTAILGFTDFICLRNLEVLPNLKEIWPLAVLVPMICGAAVTLGAGGATMAKRIIGAVVCGMAVGVFYTGVTATLGFGGTVSPGGLVTECVWRVFLFCVLSTASVLFTEISLPEPKTAYKS